MTGFCEVYFSPVCLHYRYIFSSVFLLVVIQQACELNQLPFYGRNNALDLPCFITTISIYSQRL